MKSNIIVFGASGKTGILIVYQALNQGHQVTAFARQPSKVTIEHKNLRIIRGDVLDYDKVKKLFRVMMLCSVHWELIKTNQILLFPMEPGIF